ncbi:MAG: hypothetical protein HY738_07470 [Bacteroidia bacterium]|nr:hypothetical protein [Bacteroidia bacterium]
MFYVAAQKDVTKKQRREILVNYPDSTIIANVPARSKTIKTKDFLTYYWYNTGQIKKNTGGYYGNVLDGKYTVFDRDNNMLTDGRFKKGLKHGMWKTWYPKGGLHRSEHWKLGNKTGVSAAFDKTGKLIYKLRYRDGSLHGKCYYYLNGAETITKYRKGITIPAKEKKIAFFKKTSVNEQQQPDKENGKKFSLKHLFKKEKKEKSKTDEKEKPDDVDKEKNEKDNNVKKKKDVLKNKIKKFFTNE